MKNIEALAYYEVMQKVFKEVKGYSFNMALMEAEEQLEKTKKALLKIIEQSEEFKKVNVERIKLLQKYAEKDEKGKYKTTEDGSDYIYKDEEKKEKELDSFKKKHKKLFDEQEEKEKAYQDALLEDTKYKKIDIDKKMIPKDLTTDQFRIVYKLFNVK